MNQAIEPKTIKMWPASERPRERLMQLGAAALSDAELVAVLLRSGIRGKDAITLARDLVNQCGGLRGLFALSGHDLRQVKGLGTAKAATLLAVAELARRQLKENINGRNVIRDPESVMQYLYSSLRDKTREVFKVLYLNKANCIISDRDLFYGTVDEATIHPREVVKTALDCYATALVLVHNHPSGRTEPSPEDRQMTKKIQEACATVPIRVLDHIIIGDNRFFSFCENGLLSA